MNIFGKIEKWKDSKKFNETSFLKKKILLMQITHTQKEFLKKFVSNTLLLTDVFNNFRNMCLEIYELDPVKFLSAPGLIWEATLKNTKVKLDFLTDTDVLLMVKKGIRRGICHTIYQYAKANNKYMENFDKNQEPSYLQYWDVYNL